MSSASAFNDHADLLIAGGADDAALYESLSYLMDAIGVPMMSYARYRHVPAIKRLFNERGITDAPGADAAGTWVVRRGATVPPVVHALHATQEGAERHAHQLNRADPGADWHAESWAVLTG